MQAHPTQLIPFALSLLLLLASTAGMAGLADDMARFERIYIPALALTNQPQQPAPKVAASLQRLAGAWPGMRAGLAGKSALLDRAVPGTDRAIAEAQALLAAGKRAEAHEALEAIRPAYIQARRAAGMEFYLDRLVEFHDAMEDAMKLITGGDAAPAGVRARVEEASALWRRAENPQFEAALFGFDAAKYGQLRKRVEQERAIVDDLMAALEAKDGARAGSLAKEMKTVFSQIYVMFGDFGGL